LYFPKERIAIECDEHGHYEYEEEKDIQRQDFITKSLGCQFIRFNPNQKGFNIGTVINKIIKTVETLTGEEKNEFN
jgi:very-short-patch-repair endonuclease